MNVCGGAERSTLVLAKALRERGYKVELFVTERPDWGKIERILAIGKDAIDREIVIPPFVALPTIYSKFLYWLLRDLLFVPYLRRRYELTITTIQTLPIVFSDVLYMRFPDFIPPFLDMFYEKYSSNGMRAYSLPFRLFCSYFVEAFKALQYKPLILTNSRYTRQEIQRYLDVPALVVYPPVDTERYDSSGRNRRRENIVLTISRIGEGKALRIIPRLAKKVSNGRFVIVGGSSSGRSSRYMASIRNEAKQLGVSRRILIVPNASQDEKVELLSKAKIYLHTTRFEHFGQAVVEGMSAGLVPLVPRTGGPWIDILNRSQGTWGYAYDSTDEAAGIITELLDDENLRTRLSRKASKRARDFDARRFKRLMIRIIENTMKTKRSMRK